MTKILIGVFAHPDDEAFGPCGALLIEAQAGTEVHLITLTAGEHGSNPDNVPDLGKTRLEEWHRAGEMIGATSMRHLGYGDGTLNNINHVTIAQQVFDITHQITNNRDDIEIEYMTFDLNGLTGHIDHIVAARSTCLAYYRLKEHGTPVQRVRLACWPRMSDVPNTDFVLMEPGVTDDMADEIIDARAELDAIRTIRACHHSQRADAAWGEQQFGDDIARVRFKIIS